MSHWSSPSFPSSLNPELAPHPAFPKGGFSKSNFFLLPLQKLQKSFRDRGAFPRTSSQRHQTKFPAWHHLLRLGNVSLQSRGRAGREKASSPFQKHIPDASKCGMSCPSNPCLPFPITWISTHNACSELEQLALEHYLYQKDLLLLSSKGN